jgi:hypothetical protein
MNGGTARAGAGAMIQTSKRQIGKTSTRLNPSNSDYWPSQDDPHDAWSIELLEIVAKTRPHGSLPEAALRGIVRSVHKPQPKKKVRRKAA